MNLLSINRYKMKLRKFTLLIASVSIIIMLTGCYETERGNKIGIVTKIASEGIIFKTNEVTLIRGGMSDGSGAFSKDFNFSVESPEVLAKLQAAINENKNVRITYHCEWITASWRADTNCIADDVT